MQGDLISRKRVIETIWDVFNSYANDSQRFDEYETEAINNAFTVLQKCVENQQTAYSVEKVVAELEELSLSYELNCHKMIRENKCHESEDCGICAFKQAIEIVRNGGKE